MSTRTMTKMLLLEWIACRHHSKAVNITNQPHGDTKKTSRNDSVPGKKQSDKNAAAQRNLTNDGSHLLHGARIAITRNVAAIGRGRHGRTTRSKPSNLRSRDCNICRRMVHREEAVKGIRNHSGKASAIYSLGMSSQPTVTTMYCRPSTM